MVGLCCKSSHPANIRLDEDVIKTFSKHLEDVLKTTSEDVWVRRIYSYWSRHLEDVFKTSSEDEDQRRLQDVFKTSSSRRMFAGWELLQHSPTIWITYIPILKIWRFFIFIIIFRVLVISFFKKKSFLTFHQTFVDNFYCNTNICIRLNHL